MIRFFIFLLVFSVSFCSGNDGFVSEKVSASQIVPGLYFSSPLQPQPDLVADPLLKTFTAVFAEKKIWIFVAEKPFFDTVEVGLQELYSGFFNDFFRRAPLDWSHQDISVSGDQLRNPQTYKISADVELAFNSFPLLKDGEKQFVFFACLVQKNRPVYFLSRFTEEVSKEEFAAEFVRALIIDQKKQ